MEEVKVFDPRHGWGVVKDVVGHKYPIRVKFNDIGWIWYCHSGACVNDQNQVLSFTDYTDSTPAEWATLEKIQERMKPQPRPNDGKLWKVWDNYHAEEGTFSVMCCTSIHDGKPWFSMKIGGIGLFYSNYELFEG